MYERTTEQLFELWRHTDDVRALGEAFDRTAPLLMRLARRLPRNRADAEDLVQATWLAAIEAAARFQTGRSLEAWLVGILVRQAGLARRRAQRSQVSAEVEVAHDDDPGAPLEAREFAEALTSSLARLTPSEREVLMPLLLGDKYAAEIARELGKHPQVIHVRAMRGLARLRKMLAPGLGLGLVAVLDRRALARVRERVLTSAVARVGARVGATAAASWTSGALLLLSQIVLVCIPAAAVGVLLWSAGLLDSLGMKARETDVVRSDRGSQRSGLEVPGTVPFGVRTSLAAPPDEAAPAAASPTPSRWLLRGRLQGIDPAEARTATVSVRPYDEHQPSGKSVKVVVDAHDAFEVDISSLFETSWASGDLSLAVDHPGYLPVTEKVHVEDGTVMAMDVGSSATVYRWDPQLTLAAAVRVRIWDPSGITDTNCFAEMFVLADGQVGTQESDFVQDHSGDQFLLRTRESGTYAICAWSSSSAYATAIVRADRGSETRLPDIQLDEGLGISGVVTGAGLPQPGIEVFLARVKAAGPPIYAPYPPDPWWENGRFVRSQVRTITDGNGRFEFSGLDDGMCHLFCTSCDGDEYQRIYSVTPPELVPARAPAIDVVVPLTLGIVEFRFAGLDLGVGNVSVTGIEAQLPCGGSIGDARLFRYADSPGTAKGFRFDFPGYLPSIKQVTFPEAGTVRTELVAFETRANTKLTIQLPAEHAADIHRALIQLAVLVQDSDGRDRRGFQPFRELRFEGGSIAIDGLQAGRYHVVVRPDASPLGLGGLYVDDEFTVEIPAGGEVVHALEIGIGGRARLEVKAANGITRLFAPFYLTTADGCRLTPRVYGLGATGSLACYWVESGSWDIEPSLPPGDYRIVAEPVGERTHEFPFTITASKTTEVLLDFGAR